MISDIYLLDVNISDILEFFSIDTTSANLLIYFSYSTSKKKDDERK